MIASTFDILIKNILVEEDSDEEGRFIIKSYF